MNNLDNTFVFAFYNSFLKIELNCDKERVLLKPGLDPGPGPWKTWTLESLETEKPGPWNTWGTAGCRKVIRRPHNIIY